MWRNGISFRNSTSPLEVMATVCNVINWIMPTVENSQVTMLIINYQQQQHLQSINYFRFFRPNVCSTRHLFLDLPTFLLPAGMHSWIKLGTRSPFALNERCIYLHL
jgi:hypothetical protein